MSKKCHHNEIHLHKADKKTTHAPGNASGIYSSDLRGILNPSAEPFTQPFRIKHLSDFLTLKFMTFCAILSLIMHINLAMIANIDFHDKILKHREESILLDEPKP